MIGFLEVSETPLKFCRLRHSEKPRVHLSGMNLNPSPRIPHFSLSRCGLSTPSSHTFAFTVELGRSNDNVLVIIKREMQSKDNPKEVISLFRLLKIKHSM